MKSKLPPEFTFAGFTWPRYLAVLPEGTLAERLAKSKEPTCTGGYYHAPKPDSREGKGFYLGSNGDGMPAPRYELTGDTFSFNEDGDSIEGLILRLPHGRFLAGDSMGEGMSSGVDRIVFADEYEAREAARNSAEATAERQAEHEAEDRERMAEEEAAEADSD